MKISVLLACSSLLLAGTAIPAATAAPLERPKPTTVTVTAPATAEVVSGTAVSVTGTVEGDRRKRRVQLQLRTPGGWMAVGKATRTDDAGAFTLTVPTDWFYDNPLRVRAVRTKSHRAGVSSTFPMKVTPSYTPSGDAGDWRVYDGKARWNPCKPITYRVNTRRAPDGGLAMVKAAIATLHQANGIRFKYLGKTKAIPFRDNKGKQQSDAKLDIAWATSRQVHELRNGTIGWGGLWWNGRKVAYRGGIAMLHDAAMTSDPGPGGTWNNLLIHELGHVMGLDHADTTAQVMYPQIPYSPGRYEAGDLNGLEKKGAAKGCWNGTARGRQLVGPGHASAP